MRGCRAVGYRRRPMAGLCAHTPRGLAPPPRVPPRRELCGGPLNFIIPARPRRYAVDGRWPCTPNPGRWTYQRTASPTGFPATLTWRRWRLPSLTFHRIIPPPARAPPFGSYVEMIFDCAAGCRSGPWASSSSPPPRLEWPRGRFAGAAPRPLALRTPTVDPRSRRTRVRERRQPITPLEGPPPRFLAHDSGNTASSSRRPHVVPPGSHAVTSAQHQAAPVLRREGETRTHAVAASGGYPPCDPGARR